MYMTQEELEQARQMIAAKDRLGQLLDNPLTKARRTKTYIDMTLEERAHDVEIMNVSMEMHKFNEWWQEAEKRLVVRRFVDRLSKSST